jgi:hypothetical protein
MNYIYLIIYFFLHNNTLFIRTSYISYSHKLGGNPRCHVNRTDSAHSINARSASNMIPCFPATNSTDVHHCDIVSSRSSPSHFTKNTPLNISQVRTRSTTKKLNHCLENQKGYYLRNRHTGKCSCCNLSEHD